jgi:hypothetical protein
LNLNSENKVISVAKFLGQKCVVQTGSESKMGRSAFWEMQIYAMLMQKVKNQTISVHIGLCSMEE